MYKKRLLWGILVFLYNNNNDNIIIIIIIIEGSKILQRSTYSINNKYESLSY